MRVIYSGIRAWKQGGVTMRTIKEVADLTGVSVRTLQYYDEVGVLKPTKVNEVGYRFYDDTAITRLQQILFYKELDFTLKEIKEVIQMSEWNKIEVFHKQKELLTLKRDRLNRLLELLEQLEKGETIMSFEAFDMSNYICALQNFQKENQEAIVKYWGSMENFENFIQKIKDNESEVAKIAIQQFGSLEKYTEAMKYNMEHFDEIMERVDKMAEQKESVMARSDALYHALTADKTKDVSSAEIQEIIAQIIEMTRENTAGVDMGEGFWDMVIESYQDEMIRRINDEKYGVGASEYIAKALSMYLDSYSN